MKRVKLGGIRCYVTFFAYIVKVSNAVTEWESPLGKSDPRYFFAFFFSSFSFCVLLFSLKSFSNLATLGLITFLQ